MILRAHSCPLTPTTPLPDTKRGIWMTTSRLEDKWATIGSRHIMRWPLERQGEERILEHVRRQYSRIPQRNKSLPPGAHAPGGKHY